MSDSPSMGLGGFLIGMALAGVVTGFALSKMNSDWCERIKNSSMPITFAECVPDNTEVPKNVKQN